MKQVSWGTREQNWMPQKVSRSLKSGKCKKPFVINANTL